MTIYTKFMISGTRIGDIRKSRVQKSTGTNNSSSKFYATIENFAGKNKDTFTIGNDIEIYADVDTNPPTTKIFKGILENIDYPSTGLDEQVKISGRDYTARMMDRTVEPEVYDNLPAGSIVKDIINKYTDDITVNNVDNSSTTIQRITFNHTPVFDAVKKLADLAGYSFYIDNDKDLHFKEKSTDSSGYTFDNSNVINANIKQRRDTVFNEIWVYGDRYLSSLKEEFTAGSPLGGSVFDLTYKPHNTRVDIGSPITSFTRQKGGIYGLNEIPSSGTDYLVNYNDRQIIFISGTSLGYSSIPSSGNFVTVNFDRSLPIIKVGRDNNSIAKYGKRIKKIVDKELRDPATAQDRLVYELNENNEPKIEGLVDIKGIVDITPTQTAIINLPHQGINNKTYEILEADYEFDTFHNATERVLRLKVNKKIEDITDTIKNLINEVRTIQSQDIDNSDILSRFEFAIGSVGITQNKNNIYTRSIAGSTLVYGNQVFGIWNSYKWGDTTTSSFVLGTVGAVLGVNKLGTQLSEWVLSWSGG